MSISEDPGSLLICDEGDKMGKKGAHGLILQQPWARLVAEGVIPILIRPIPVRIRGKVSIVARGVDPCASVDGKYPQRNEFPQPAVIGSVFISGCSESMSLRHARRVLAKRLGKRFEQFYPKHFLSDKHLVYLWFLEKPRMLKRAKPIQVGRHRVWMIVEQRQVRKRGKRRRPSHS